MKPRDPAQPRSPCRAVRASGVGPRIYLLVPRHSVPKVDGMTRFAADCDMPTATKTVRISRSRLAEAGPILERLGMDSRSAIELFLAQVVSRKAIPFAVALPDSEYAATEYGLSAADVVAAGKRMRRASSGAHRSGGVRAVSGIDSLRE